MIAEGDNHAAHARAMAEAAADALRGTCKGIADLGEEHEALFDTSIAYTERLDELVFECVCCNWWCEMSEMADDCGDELICAECANNGAD